MNLTGSYLFVLLYLYVRAPAVTFDFERTPVVLTAGQCHEWPIISIEQFQYGNG